MRTMASSIEGIENEKVLWLTTIGSKTGLSRAVEIWFVVYGGRLYLFSEKAEAANWVRNIRVNANVTVRIGDWQAEATARVLDHDADRTLWDQVAAIAHRKYGWGEGLPVELTPSFTPASAQSPRSATANPQ
jgi:deazaflavin-dependent oxidoreductase (nitroreductase family)